jgi:hypothetical protein
MAGLVPAIHVFLIYAAKTWMPGTSPGMTTFQDATTTTHKKRPSAGSSRPPGVMNS